MKFKRIIVVVADSLGVGNDVRAEEFGDKNSNTWGHISESRKLNMPNFNAMGVGEITQIANMKSNHVKGYACRLNALSNAKDTMAGHWEMVGIFTKHPFPTFTETGFPKELIDKLEKATGRKIIGNRAASGTEILKELGEQEIKNGSLIVYTSGDSVLQICGHEKYMGLETLYKYSEMAREICNSNVKWKVGRIIARPYDGETPETFARTSNRHDYTVFPTQKTILNNLSENNFDVISVGKINDIFSGYGVTEKYHSINNSDGMKITTDLLKKDFKGLLFTNLVDFDSKYGHRRNVEGYAKAIEIFDKEIAILMNAMNEDDLLIVTADHGNDPTFPGSDHTRENIPMLSYSKKMTKSGIMPVGGSYADIGDTIADNFNVKKSDIGTSFLDKLL